MPSLRVTPTGLPFSAECVDRPALAALTLETCRRLRFLPTFSWGLLLQAAMPDPDACGAVAAIRHLTHQEVRPFGVRAADFDAALTELAPAGEAGARAESRAPPSAPVAWPLRGSDSRALALTLVRYAAAAGASDLLLDDQESWLEVALQRSGAKEILPPVERSRSAGLIRAFKEMAGLSTQTVLTAQSGAVRLALGGGPRIDLRLEITPTVHGESLVARLQDPEEQRARLASFPFREPGQAAAVRESLAAGQGLIVATGPTGHGKTTTLYACLGQLDRSRVNIRTLEDPVERIVPWITQIPVSAAAGRDFASGLRSVLRQAPQVILLGEIRDRTAAATCLEAVDTGHLLLATLHTRDAIGVVARLLDLGISGRQIASGLSVAIGQRLLRRLCPHCRGAGSPSPEAMRQFAAWKRPIPDRIWRAAGCDACGGRGEAGRIPVFEIFRPRESDTVEQIVATATLHAFDERELRRRWRAQGGRTLAEAALDLAAAGEVAYEEAQPLAMFPA